MKYLFNHQRKRFWLYTFCVCLSCVCEICLAFIMSSCIDLALQQKIGLFWRYGIRFIAFILVYMIIDYSAQRTRHRLLQKAQNFLRDETLSNILLLDSDTFHKKNTGEWVSTLTNDVEVIGQSYFSIILDFIPQIISFVSCTALLCYLSWPLAMFVIAFTLLQMLIPKILAPRISDAKEAQSNAASSFTVSASEHFQGYSLLHGLNLTKYSCDALSASNARWEKAKFRAKHMTIIANTLSYGCGNVVYIGLYFIGAILVAKGHMSLGTMVAITQLSVYIMGPLQTFAERLQKSSAPKRFCKKCLSLRPAMQKLLRRKRYLPKRFRTLCLIMFRLHMIKLPLFLIQVSFLKEGKSISYPVHLDLVRQRLQTFCGEIWNRSRAQFILITTHFQSLVQIPS